MSVHELKRPPIADTTEWQVKVPRALEQLQHWAQVSPLQPALRHKRHGQWVVWRWIDVLRDVERLVDGLRQQGFTEDSRLALSGTFEPNLLLLALAARHIDAELLTLPDNLDPEALHKALWCSRPTHSFVQARQTQQLWINQGQSPLNFADLFGPVEAPQRLSRWNQDAQLWSEEGTQWQHGLTVLLEQWLTSGQSLAFPESPGSASRDRREVAPSGLLLSAERLQLLAAEIDSRLAPHGTWRRRLCDWAIAHPEKGLQRLIKNRVRHLLGFHNLRFIWQATRISDAQPEPAWLAEFKRDIA
ncbi:acyl-CoA synthetase [Pseudomonas frederiksbergensis]|uniref:Acyl-CoA synthetase n=1 Tax=Pseudomonas frederiksbergensis TaxID=104087 RepID=A0A2S8HQ28_9PSED|nr:acyl-CoA synthetase [Pseudomonas frederiksbergensis]PQP04495.1 acyl-CoA synthetase [Pseudomonas frederiksbergensis]